MNENFSLKNLNRVMFVLALGGIAISCHLLFAKMAEVSVGGCGDGHGCDAVNNSRYAVLFGIPISALGVAGYSFLMLLTLGRAVAVNDEAKRFLGNLLLICVAAALLFTMRLEFLMLFKLGICRWCMGSAAIILVMAILLILERKWQQERALNPISGALTDATTRRKARLFERNLFLVTIAAGVLVILSDKTYYENRPKPRPPPPVSSISPATYDLKELDAPGSIGFGPRDAKVVLAEFLNYQCSHCRESEPIMEALRKKYSGKVRFVLHYYRIARFPYGEYGASALQSAWQEKPEIIGALHEQWMKEEKIDQENIDKVLKSIGLNPDQINREAKAEKFKASLDADQTLAHKVGVSGSPTLIVNHTRFIYPFNQTLIEKEIDALLEGKPSPSLPGGPPPRFPTVTPSPPAGKTP